MRNFDSALIVTHVVHKKTSPYQPVEGPYSSVGNSFKPIIKEIYTCQIPLGGFKEPVIYGKWEKTRQFKLPKIFGQKLAIKYIIDIFIIIILAFAFNFKNRGKKRLIVGIDPLSCLPLTLFKKILNYRLVFYSVDFNRHRFNHPFTQWLYEKADEISSCFSNQTWVTSQSLKKYKKQEYGIEPIYIPNSSIFNAKLYEDGKKVRTGNKIAWTGSFSTERLYNTLFGLLKEIQDCLPYESNFCFAPINDHHKFKQYALKYQLKKFQILTLNSRLEWQKFAATCDVGIAVYDEKFGLTEFIEPLKMWDFLLCGLPFIISCEPLILSSIKKSGVAYFLLPGNKIPQDNSLKNFLDKENLVYLQSKCLRLAQKFDIQKQIIKALKKI